MYIVKNTTKSLLNTDYSKIVTLRSIMKLQNSYLYGQRHISTGNVISLGC